MQLSSNPAQKTPTIYVVDDQKTPSVEKHTHAAIVEKELTNKLAELGVTAQVKSLHEPTGLPPAQAFAHLRGNLAQIDQSSPDLRGVVINMSFSIPLAGLVKDDAAKEFKETAAMMKDMMARGAVFVTASGNEDRFLNALSGVSGVISVGTGGAGREAASSETDVTANGKVIFQGNSVGLKPTTPLAVSDNVGIVDGTSFAAPTIAARIAAGEHFSDNNSFTRDDIHRSLSIYPKYETLKPAEQSNFVDRIEKALSAVK